MAATSCSKASKRSSADILSKPLHQQPNVHDSPRVRSTLLRYRVDVYQCDDTIFSSRFEPEDCMRTFSQSEPTRLLSSLQGASISQQHRLRCHRIQGPYHQYPQVPTVSLVPCPTFLNTTKPDFHQHSALFIFFAQPSVSFKRRRILGPLRLKKLRGCRCFESQTSKTPEGRSATFRVLRGAQNLFWGPQLLHDSL